MTPIISVIIPAYNSEKTIRETIASVLKQSFTDFELLIINDGSTDTTLESISSIEDSRVRIFTYPNGGLAVSRNRGIAHACGEYISFLDADDLWTTDKLELQLKALQENPNAAVAYSWNNFIDEQGRLLRQGVRPNTIGNVYAELLLGNFLQNGSNILVSKQAVEQVGYFDETLPAAQDWDIYLRLAAQYNFIVVPKPQVLYRVSTNSMSTNLLRLEKACMQVFEKAYSQAPKSLQSLKPNSIENFYSFAISKALEDLPKPNGFLIAVKLFWHCIQYDFFSIQRLRFKLRLIKRITINSLIFTSLSQ